MVPSWTETLIEAGVDVVGRTAFCTEPKNKVDSIPIVGGTKNIQWNKVKNLNADFLILDKEENPKVMADNAIIPYLATHIEGIQDMPKNLLLLGEGLKNETLKLYAEEWEQLINQLSQKKLNFSENWQFLPGVIEWWKLPEQKVKQVVYLIWQDPWMSVSRQTFIGSVLSQLGLGELLPPYVDKYPEIQLHNYDPRVTLLLFSTEPYDFAGKKPLLKDLGYPCALVDGSKWSWFGHRSLRFLQEVVKRNNP